MPCGARNCLTHARFSRWHARLGHATARLARLCHGDFPVPVADAVCIFPCGGYRQIFLSESAQLTRHVLSAAHPNLCNLIDPPKAAAVFGRCSEKNVAIFPQSASSLPMYREYPTVTPAPSILEKTLAHLTIYEDLARAEKPEQFELIFRRLQQEWIAIGGLVRVLAETFESSLLTTGLVVGRSCCVRDSYLWLGTHVDRIPTGWTLPSCQPLQIQFLTLNHICVMQSPPAVFPLDLG